MKKNLLLPFLLLLTIHSFAQVQPPRDLTTLLTERDRLYKLTTSTKTKKFFLGYPVEERPAADH
jgi:hypothetical protein